MLMNKQTNGVLVFDIGDKIVSLDEAYACTTSDKNVGPCGRSIVHLARVDDDDEDPVLKYGQEVRFVTNAQFFFKPLFLHSC